MLWRRWLVALRQCSTLWFRGSSSRPPVSCPSSHWDSVQRRDSVDRHRDRQCRVPRSSSAHSTSVQPDHHAAGSSDRPRGQVHPVDVDRSAVRVSSVRGVECTCTRASAVCHAGRQPVCSSRTRHLHDAASPPRRPLQSLRVDVLRTLRRQLLLQTPSGRRPAARHPVPSCRPLLPRSQ